MELNFQPLKTLLRGVDDIYIYIYNPFGLALMRSLVFGLEIFELV